MGTTPVVGTFGAIGQSAVFTPARGKFNAPIASGGAWVGSVTLQRSFDGGTTWVNTDTTLTADSDVIREEPGANVQYRWDCTARTSGSIGYRLSQ